MPLSNQYKVKYYYEAINTGTIFIDYMMLSQHGAYVLRGVTRVHHSYSTLLIFRSRELFIYKSFLEFRKYLYLKTLCFLGLVFCGELGWMWVRIEGHYCIVLMCCNWNKSVKVIVGLRTESWGCNVI